MTVRFRPLKFRDRSFTSEHADDGSIIVSSTLPLEADFKPVTARIAYWAEQRPNTGAFFERRDGIWSGLTWFQLDQRLRRVAQGLLNLGLNQNRPLAIAAPNSIDVLVLTFAALHVGIPVVPLSPMYFVPQANALRVRHILSMIDPGIVVLEGEQLLNAGSTTMIQVGQSGRAFVASCLSEQETATVRTRHTAIQPGDVAKVMFTSGSVGLPKGVVQTHGMIEAARRAHAAQMSDVADGTTQAFLDWMPWHHVMGGNIGLHRNLTYGGLYHIDGGRPTPGRFDETIQNLKDVRPTFYSSVPIGYAMLIPALEADEALARRFFSRLSCLAFGGAAMSSDLQRRYCALTEKLFGERIAFVAGYGSTESCGPALSQYWASDEFNQLGLPLAGITAKLVPTLDAFELRLKGNNLFSGYLGADAASDCFDENGFFKTGDLVEVNAGVIGNGLKYRGRLSENFKLSSGTWVDVTAIRAQLSELFAPLVLDAVICGHERDDVRALLWPRPSGFEATFGRPFSAIGVDKDPDVLSFVHERMTKTARGGSSQSVRAVRFMKEPPSLKTGEINDKGYVNQRRCVEIRRDDVNALYAEQKYP
jgi:feruloyl-CoA synthase